jgi:hypothetical protein
VTRTDPGGNVVKGDSQVVTGPAVTHAGWSDAVLRKTMVDPTDVATAPGPRCHVAGYRNETPKVSEVNALRAGARLTESVGPHAARQPVATTTHSARRLNRMALGRLGARISFPGLGLCSTSRFWGDGLHGVEHHGQARRRAKGQPFHSDRSSIGVEAQAGETVEQGVEPDTQLEAGEVHA